MINIIQPELLCEYFCSGHDKTNNDAQVGCRLCYIFWPNEVCIYVAEMGRSAKVMA